MSPDDLILVSIDDHVVEPPDMFLNHVPEKYKEEAPIVVTDDKSVDQWMYQGRPQGVSGSPSPATTDSATRRPPPVAASAEATPFSAQVVSPMLAFSTLQPVTMRPSSTSAAAPTRTPEYGA